VIIGLSGQKQPGKSLLCKDIFTKYFIGNSHSFRAYSFADSLKKKVCMEVMGLTRKQCYGTDEQKNTLTEYKWENLPRYIRYDNKRGCKYAPNGEVSQHILPTGFMTARSILQVVGTDIFRRFFNDNIWVETTFRVIEKDNPEIAIIEDVRFPSEVTSIINRGGYIIRLLRDVCDDDFHSSERSLDDYDFVSLGKQCFVLDNQNMAVEEKNESIFFHLENEWKIKRILDENS